MRKSSKQRNDEWDENQFRSNYPKDFPATVIKTFNLEMAAGTT
jgi:hypothetical protein